MDSVARPWDTCLDDTMACLWVCFGQKFVHSVEDARVYANQLRHRALAVHQFDKPPTLCRAWNSLHSKLTQTYDVWCTAALLADLWDRSCPYPYRGIGTTMTATAMAVPHFGRDVSFPHSRAGEPGNESKVIMSATSVRMRTCTCTIIYVKYKKHFQKMH